MPVSAWLIDALDPQPGQTLLELAAGTGDTGLLAAELVAPAGEADLSDFAEAMLAAARRRAEELGIANVRFKQIDAETSIDLPAASVDGVLCRWGFMLLADPGAALQRARAACSSPAAGSRSRPGRGRRTTAGARCPTAELVAARARRAARPGGAGPVRLGAPTGVIAEQLEEAGFVEHHVEALDFTMDYASPEAWWEAPGGTLLPPRDRDRRRAPPTRSRRSTRGGDRAPRRSFGGPEGTVADPRAHVGGERGSAQ